MTLALAAIAALMISLVAAVRPASVSAFTAGDNGHPTNGPYSDLKGGTGTFTFETDGVPHKFRKAVADHSQKNYDVNEVLAANPRKGWAVNADDPKERNVDRQAIARKATGGGRSCRGCRRTGARLHRKR